MRLIKLVVIIFQNEIVIIFSKLGRVRDQKGCITLDTLRTTIKVIIFHKCVFIDYLKNFSKYLELSRPICVKIQLKPA